MRQILLNLLVERGEVHRHRRREREGDRRRRACGAPDNVGIEIVVEDTGIGLSPEDMRGLFTEFEQAETAIRRRNGGTGLGLAISMQLARAMGGEIRVVSAPGKGSTFTASLILRRICLRDRTAPSRPRSPKPGGCSSPSTVRWNVAR